ncbi:MAG TPA: mannosyltransferase family protein [Acidimicrobiia bacterium]|nr:mannosyltransferase family protein [Acidimicrobiia bacterium]
MPAWGSIREGRRDVPAETDPVVHIVAPPAAGSAPPEDAGAEPAPAATPLLARPLATPLLAYAASRLITTVAVGLAAMASHQSFQRVLTVWDGHWYVRIATVGYPHTVPQGDFYAGTGRQVQSAIAFFPLYPVLVRGLDRVFPGGADVAGAVLSLLIGVLATVLVWVVAEKVTDRAVADRAAVLFAFSPGAFVLTLVYAEGLLVLLSAAALLALLERRWLAAGVLAALAGATRPNATAVMLACAWAAGVALWRNREWRAVVAPVLSPLGMLAFFAFLWWHTGEALIWFRVESQGWGEGIDFGRSNLGVFADVFTRPLHNPNMLVLAASMIAAAVLMVILVRAKLPAVLNVYALTGLALVLISHINARPRFIFVAFPLVIALAKTTTRRQSAFVVLTAVFAACTVMLTVFYGLHKLNYYP